MAKKFIITVSFLCVVWKTGSFSEIEVVISKHNIDYVFDFCETVEQFKEKY